MSDIPKNDDRSAAERLTFAVSIAIVAGIAGLVILLAIDRGNDPPLIEATALVDQLRAERGVYALPIAVANRGDSTAKDVLIEVELVTPGQPAETAEFTLPFLPAGARERGTVVFATNPADGEVTVSVRSYLRP